MLVAGPAVLVAGLPLVVVGLPLVLVGLPLAVAGLPLLVADLPLLVARPPPVQRSSKCRGLLREGSPHSAVRRWSFSGEHGELFPERFSVAAAQAFVVYRKSSAPVVAELSQQEYMRLRFEMVNDLRLVQPAAGNL